MQNESTVNIESTARLQMLLSHTDRIVFSDLSNKLDDAPYSEIVRRALIYAECQELLLARIKDGEPLTYHFHVILPMKTKDRLTRLQAAHALLHKRKVSKNGLVRKAVRKLYEARGGVIGADVTT